MIGLNQKLQYLNHKIFVRKNDKTKVFFNYSYLDKVRNYFGDNVAFYFAFTEYYTKALIPTAILGKNIFLS